MACLDFRTVVFWEMGGYFLGGDSYLNNRHVNRNDNHKLLGFLACEIIIDCLLFIWKG